MAVSTSSASQDVMSVAIFVASLLANPVAGHPRFIAVVRAACAAVHFKKAKACDPSRPPTSTEKATTVASYRLALSSSPCSAARPGLRAATALENEHHNRRGHQLRMPLTMARKTRHCDCSNPCS